MTNEGIVTKLLPNDMAEVAVVRQTACGGSCSSCEGCMYEREMKTAAKNLVNARPGQRVVIESRTSVIFNAALLVYVMPLVLFIAAYAIAAALGAAEGEMISGIALFGGDKMTASLDPSDAAYYMLARGKLRGVQLTFSDGTYAEITENKSKISVKGNKVSVKITAEGIFGGGTKDINSEREFAEAEIRERTRAVLRLAERSGCDILGAKGEAAKNYLTIKKWQNFTPDEDAADVEVKLTLTRGVNG